MEWLEKIIGWLIMIWSGLKKTWNAKHSSEEIQVKTVLTHCSYTILKLRDRSTVGMKTLRSSSVVFIVKKLKYRSICAWKSAGTKLWPGDGILVISQSTALQIGWFLKHWKTNSNGYVYRRGSSAFIYEK
mgnify:CR=1 FL=1